MLMYSALDAIEDEKLKTSEYGIRAGKEGAWIEVGHKSSIGKNTSYIDKFRPAAYTMIDKNTVTKSGTGPTQSNPAVTTVNSNAQGTNPQKQPLQSSGFAGGNNFGQTQQPTTVQGTGLGQSNMGPQGNLGASAMMKQSVVNDCYKAKS